MQRGKSVAQCSNMGVSREISHTTFGIAVFVLSLLLACALLYFISYENAPSATVGVTDIASSSVRATETTGVSTATASSTSPKAQKDASGALKTATPWKKTMTTYFYVGEPSDADNAYIPNDASYWDEKWQAHFGGIDSPNCRSGYIPCEFTPKENPFYFALPYAEYDPAGKLKVSAQRVPWYKPSFFNIDGTENTQLLKNRWIAVRHAGQTCYAQWEDVGPNGEDDFAYVFGKAAPINTFGAHAGLDASPALWKCLHMSDNDYTEWAFVDASAVPAGPWKDIVTTSGTSWGN